MSGCFRSQLCRDNPTGSDSCSSKHGRSCRSLPAKEPPAHGAEAVRGTTPKVAEGGRPRLHGVVFCDWSWQETSNGITRALSDTKWPSWSATPAGRRGAKAAVSALWLYGGAFTERFQIPGMPGPWERDSLLLKSQKRVWHDGHGKVDRFEDGCTPKTASSTETCKGNVGAVNLIWNIDC